MRRCLAGGLSSLGVEGGREFNEKVRVEIPFVCLSGFRDAGSDHLA